MDDRVSPQASAHHEAHDLHLVARFAAGDAGTGEASRARELLAACPACAELAADLRAISAATRASAATRGSMLAPRDFRLSPVDAARIRRRGPAGWRTALGSVAGLLRARGAAGLVALGLVGILVGTGVPGAFLGGMGAGGAAPESGATRDLAVPEPAYAPAASDVGQSAATAAPARTTQFAASSAAIGAAVASESPAPALAAPIATDAGSHGAVAVAPATTEPSAAKRLAGTEHSTPASTGSAVLLAASAIAIVVGLVLLVVGRRGRRTGS